MQVDNSYITTVNINVLNNDTGCSHAGSGDFY